MRVSVVLPVRNGGAFLAPAVASILTQSLRDLELLVVDDGSSDGAVAALGARDDRLRVLKSPGVGLVAALNFGLAEARCDLVARMDSDDIALPERLARQVAFLESEPNVAVVGSQVAFIDAYDKLTGERTHFPTEPEAVAAALLKRGCVLKHPSVVARRATLLGAGGYRAAFAKAEDYDLWLRLAETSRLANLPDVLLNYRVHPDQVSSGINLGQRLSHDFAVLAARDRRAGRPDPFDGVGAPIAFDRLDPAIAFLPPSVASIASAYRALAYFEAMTAEAPTSAALADVVANARRGYLGDGRRYRALSLVRCARLAFRRGHWRLAAEAAHLALRLAPSRAAKWLIRGAGGQAPLSHATA